MKQTLKPQWVLNWSLLGLKPMHRALIRRCVNQFNLPDKSSSIRQPIVAWDFEDWDKGRDKFTLSMLHREGILIVDSDALLSHASRQQDAEFILAALHTPFKGQIRLLWNWTMQGKLDLLWCTEMTFDGVISDTQTLRAWLSNCLRLGSCGESQSNGLLQGIELPMLSSTGMHNSGRQPGIVTHPPGTS